MWQLWFVSISDLVLVCQHIFVVPVTHLVKIPRVRNRCLDSVTEALCSGRHSLDSTCFTQGTNQEAVVTNQNWCFSSVYSSSLCPFNGDSICVNLRLRG